MVRTALPHPPTHTPCLAPQISHRPLLIGAILSFALLAEWALERVEDSDRGRRGADHRNLPERSRGILRHAGSLGRLAVSSAQHLPVFGPSFGAVLLPMIVGLVLSTTAWLLLPDLLAHPASVLAPAFDWGYAHPPGALACRPA
eukprot:scaffold232997_cov33-Tisochrysis_lutea.AAC.1